MEEKSSGRTRMDRSMGHALFVIWKHLPEETAGCVQCSDTHLTFPDLFSSIRPLLEHDGILVTYEEQLSAPSGNQAETGFYLNGHPLEGLLRDCDRAQFLCHSSKCEPFVSSVYITRDEAGNRCIRAPEMLFRKAILASLEDA